ncbi:MAG TPA: hypothetical protein VEP91_05170 [Solirubrobacterales bacterium]|nr:hypothetical protein [Solirubrobacterales bacterium]
MKADYDSEADALSIDLVEADRCDDGFSVDKGENCNLALAKGRIVNVELLYPAENLELLTVAAERFDLDGEGLLAAARAALAAPDRLVTLGLSRRLAGSS